MIDKALAGMIDETLLQCRKSRLYSVIRKGEDGSCEKITLWAR